MKYLTTILITSLFLFSSQKIVAQEFNIATYNIRFDNPGDEGNLWKDRAPHLASIIRFHDIALFGTQEGLLNQLEDLENMLGYTFVGSGRDDGKKGGEHSAIFYDPSKFELLESGDFWLSETPDIPSIGWDAAMNRICTYARFKSPEGLSFWVFNAHYDHVGQEARKESSKLIMKKITEQVQENEQVVFMGDLNVTPENEAYKTITDAGWLLDSYKITKSKAHGPEGTFNAYNWDMMPDRRIDYVFVSKGISVEKYGVLSDNYGKKYPSDHFAVLTRLKF